MKIALIGYGKMGRIIEKIALSRGHQVLLRIDIQNADELNAANLARVDAAIEFTGPHSAFTNVMKCLEAGTPVVCGSTGWLDRFEEVSNYCLQHEGGLIYASNFSIGVNIFFEMNRRLAALMKHHKEYEVSLTEIHHTEKKDAPSGTAITLAEDILSISDIKKDWVNHTATKPDELTIISERRDPAPGTHAVKYSSSIDDIEIIHTAHNREGFATGAVLAAEFIAGKKGVFGMKEVLGI